jgi:hypothetical protein
MRELPAESNSLYRLWTFSPHSIHEGPLLISVSPSTSGRTFRRVGSLCLFPIRLPRSRHGRERKSRRGNRAYLYILVSGVFRRQGPPVRWWTNSIRPSPSVRRCHMPGSTTGVTRGKTLCAMSRVISTPCPRASTRLEHDFAGVAVPSPPTSLNSLLRLRCHLLNRL